MPPSSSPTKWTPPFHSCVSVTQRVAIPESGSSRSLPLCPPTPYRLRPPRTHLAMSGLIGSAASTIHPCSPRQKGAHRRDRSRGRREWTEGQADRHPCPRIKGRMVHWSVLDKPAFPFARFPWVVQRTMLRCPLSRKKRRCTKAANTLRRISMSDSPNLWPSAKPHHPKLISLSLSERLFPDSHYSACPASTRSPIAHSRGTPVFDPTNAKASKQRFQAQSFAVPWTHPLIAHPADYLVIVPGLAGILLALYLNRQSSLPKRSVRATTDQLSTLASLRSRPPRGSVAHRRNDVLIRSISPCFVPQSSPHT